MTRVRRLKREIFWGAIAALLLCTSLLPSATGGRAGSSQDNAARATRKGPAVRVIHLPDFWGEYAIWGSTGADSQGRIYLGITSNDQGSGSAHLFRYDPQSDAITDCGNVVEELTRLGLRAAGDKQMKIHSRIVQMPDGYVYFASMDETGEQDDGSKLPTWGGHLWRIGSTGRWQHLAHTREALIAVTAGGRYVYALGYFNNVLNQYDTRTGKVAAKTVGTFGGHVTRNFFADDRGHAFVPRVARAGDAATPTFAATLVEFDAALQEIGSQPLPEYLDRSPDDSHGIVATHPDGSGGWYFASSKGRLYHETPTASGPAAVADMGWYHPGGPRYVASMFRDGSSGTLYGVANGSGNGSAFEWVTRRVDGTTTVAPLPYGDVPFPNGAVLYGSMTHDTQGRFYVVGSMHYKPVVLQITP